MTPKFGKSCTGIGAWNCYTEATVNQTQYHTCDLMVDPDNNQWILASILQGQAGTVLHRVYMLLYSSEEKRFCMKYLSQVHTKWKSNGACKDDAQVSHMLMELDKWEKDQQHKHYAPHTLENTTSDITYQTRSHTTKHQTIQQQKQPKKQKSSHHHGSSSQVPSPLLPPLMPSSATAQPPFTIEQLAILNQMLASQAPSAHISQLPPPPVTALSHMTPLMSTLTPEQLCALSGLVTGTTQPAPPPASVSSALFPGSSTAALSNLGGNDLSFPTLWMLCHQWTQEANQHAQHINDLMVLIAYYLSLHKQK